MEDFSRRRLLSAAATLGSGVVSTLEAARPQSPAPAQQPVRRTSPGSPTAAAQPKAWKPKLGILANFSEANVLFAKNQGFTSIGLFAHTKTTLDLSLPLLFSNQTLGDGSR